MKDNRRITLRIVLDRELVDGSGRVALETLDLKGNDVPAMPDLRLGDETKDRFVQLSLPATFEQAFGHPYDDADCLMLWEESDAT